MRWLESTHSDLLREIESALTGTDRDIGECFRHLRLIEEYSAVTQSETDVLPLVEEIFRMRFIKRSALAGELFGTFHKMCFGRGLSILERLHRAISSGLFAVTADIFFTIDNGNWEFVPWHILNRDSLPCLERMVIDLDFRIDILREGQEKSLWTTLEEHMQETIANRGAKQIVLWLNLRDKGTSSRNEPNTVQQFETMLGSRMEWRGWKKYKRSTFVLA